MRRSILLLPVFIFLLPLQINAMIVETESFKPSKECSNILNLINNDKIILGKNDLLELKRNTPVINDITMNHNELIRPFINFKKIQKEVIKEQGEEEENKLCYPLKFLNKAPLILSKEEKVIIDSIFQNVLKEKEYADNEALAAQPKVEKKVEEKKNKKTVGFLINEENGLKIPLSKDDLTIEKITQLQKKIMEPIPSEQSITTAKIEQADVKIQNNGSIAAISVPKEESKNTESLPIYGEIDAEIKELEVQKDGSNDILLDKYIRSLHAYKTYLKEKTSGTDQEKLMQLMFKEHKGTLPEVYNSILKVVDSNSPFIISSWLSKFLTAEAEFCGGFSYFKNRTLFFDMINKMSLLKKFFECDLEQKEEKDKCKILAYGMAAIGSYAIRFKMAKKRKDIEKETLGIFQPFNEKMTGYWDRVGKGYINFEENLFDISKKCPRENLFILSFLTDKADEQSEEPNSKVGNKFLAQYSEKNQQDAAPDLILGLKKIGKVIQDQIDYGYFNVSDCFKGLELWQQMVDKQPNKDITLGTGEPIYKIFINEKIFLPLRRRAQELFLPLTDSYTEGHEQRKKDIQAQCDMVKKEINSFITADKTDAEIKAKAEQAYLLGLDEQALKLFGALKEQDIESMLYSADIYCGGKITINSDEKIKMKPFANAVALLAKESLISKLFVGQLVDGKMSMVVNAHYYGLYQNILKRLIQKRYVGAAHLSLVTNEWCEFKFQKYSFQKKRISDLGLLLTVPNFEATGSLLSMLDRYSEGFAKGKGSNYISSFGLLIAAMAARKIGKKIDDKEREWCKKWIKNFIDKTGYMIEPTLYENEDMSRMMAIVYDELAELPDKIKMDDPEVGYAYAVAASYMSLMPKQQVFPEKSKTEKLIWGLLKINELSGDHLNFYSEWSTLYSGNRTEKIKQIDYMAAQKGCLPPFRRYAFDDVDRVINGKEDIAEFIKENKQEQALINTLLKNNPNKQEEIYFLWLQKKAVTEEKMGLGREILNKYMSKLPDQKAYRIAELCLDEKELETKLALTYIGPRAICGQKKFIEVTKEAEKLLERYIDWLKDPQFNAKHANWIVNGMMVESYFNALHIVLKSILNNGSNEYLNNFKSKLNLVNRFVSMLTLISNNHITLAGIKLGCDNMGIKTTATKFLKLEAEMFCSLAENVLNKDKSFSIRRECAVLFINKAHDLAKKYLKNADQKSILEKINLLSQEVAKIGSFTRIINGIPTQVMLIANKVASKNQDQLKVVNDQLKIVGEVTKKAELANKQLKEAENNLSGIDAMIDSFLEQDAAVS